MNCPKCGEHSKVVTTRTFDGQTMRTRECSNCKYRFYTEELECDKNDCDMVYKKYYKVTKGMYKYGIKPRQRY